MAALTADFTNHTTLVYNTNGTHMISTSVTSYDRDARYVYLAKMPKELNINDNCKLIILTSPTPCEFMGRVKKFGGSLYIALFQGQEKESRESQRYPVSNPALITALFENGEAHRVQTPIKVMLINISTSGIRFRAPFYSFEVGDEFQMDLYIGNNQKKITAKVINSMDQKDNLSDYGCLFLLVQ